MERRDRYKRRLGLTLTDSVRDKLKQQLRDVEAVISQLEQAKEQKIAELRRQYDNAQQS